ncbi:MAG: c-type cytochrome [Bryobacterales bacterium]|nr:c-type cytochrome [Bryobacterales bacterium]
MKKLLVFLALPVLAQQLDTGKRIFESQCALCHGPDGSGGRGPNLRKAKLKNAPDEDVLKKVIVDGIPPEMPGAWQLHPAEVTATAAYVRSLGKLVVEEIAGVPAAGENVFANAGCVACHIVNGKGIANGPELSAIGSRRNAKHLRESITAPNSFLPDGFQILEVTDAAGRISKGVKANEDLFTIQLTLSDGRHASFQKASLKGLRRITGQSTMPAFNSLAAIDLDNLVAYLVSLKGAE